MSFRGITWDHPRGRNALEAAALIASREPDGVEIAWKAHSLEHFESHPIDELAAEYDLIVLDHPHLGEAIATESLVPLDDVFAATLLSGWRAESVGPSFDSYTMEGRQWALPLDAATQVAAYRTSTIAEPPATWDDVLTLASSAPVALSLAGPHAFLTFASMCVAFGEPVAEASDRFVSRQTALAVLEVASQIVELAPPGADSLNPIRMLERMSSDGDIAYVPLVYGYVNYATPELHFADAPAAAGRTRPGSTLGGTGLALSRRCAITPELLAHVEWLMSESTQRRFIPVSMGQPSRRSAWLDPLVDAAGHGFYSGTLATIEHAWVRPRYDGFIAFQTRASAIIRQILLDEVSTDDGLAALDAGYRASVRARSTSQEAPIS